ncbi:MAG: glutaredoxin family protein [Deltaproteobacteria bacterium]|nr:glutaredoxin family protein [Deltaproteobacteria bacterium]
MPPKIVVFSMATCPYCISLKGFLKEKGLEYTDYDVEHDLDNYALMKKMAPGIRTVPAVVINDGEKILTGFERAEYEAALAETGA